MRQRAGRQHAENASGGDASATGEAGRRADRGDGVDFGIWTPVVAMLLGLWRRDRDPEGLQQAAWVEEGSGVKLRLETGVRAGGRAAGLVRRDVA